MFSLIRDVRYAVRTLYRARVLTVTAVLTLGIGIGGVTAMSSVVDAVLIRSVPFPHVPRLSIIWQRDPADPSRVGEVSYYTYRLWHSRARSFTDMAALGSVNWSLDLTGRGERRVVPFAAVSSSFFQTLGVSPTLGRGFLPEDDRPQSARVVVISYGFWQTALGGDHGIVGASLVLSGISRTVVGIMPVGFDFPRGASMWAPLVPEIASIRIGEFNALDAQGFGILYVLGRVRDGVTAASASADLDSIARDDAAANGFKDANIPPSLLTPLRDFVSENTRPALVALAATCTALLLIACTNVVSLLLMRVSSARRLFAIRAALGASRRRIIREELAVVIVLSVSGLLTGIAVAAVGVHALLAVAPPALPVLRTVRMDPRAILCAAVACVGAVLACGVMPALRAANATSIDMLVGRSTAGVSTTRLRNVLVTFQVAAALVLVLLCAGSIQSVRHIRAIDLGFEPHQLVTLNASVPDESDAQQRQFSRALLIAARALPDVTAAAAVSLRPLQGVIGNDMSFLLEGQRPFPALDVQKNPIVVHEAITPGYFRTMGTRLLRGRDFDDRDDSAGAPVAIVSEGLARIAWPGQEAIGKRLQLSDAPTDANGAPRWVTVVGVAADVRYRGMTDTRPDLYVPYFQTSELVPHVMIRTTGQLMPLVAAMRVAARRLNPHASVDGLDTMDAVVERAGALWTFNMWLFSVFGVTALALSAVGLYGLLAYFVSERKRELGLRLALGAAPGHVTALVVRRALLLTLLGLGVGLAIAAGLARFAESLVYEVRPLDLSLVAFVCLAVLVVAAIASYVPARRAAAIDPATVLRME
jgi:predicted permease